MGPVARYYQKIGLVAGVPFGTLSGLSLLLMSLLVAAPVEWGLLFALLGGVASGLFFGFFMALIIGTWQIRAVRKLGFPLTAENLAVRHRRTLTLACPFDEAFRHCLEALRALENTAVLEETDFQQGVIHARKGLSFYSFGEKIRIDLEESTSDQTALTIRCGPVWSTTLADYGTNLSNLDTIITRLLEYTDRPSQVRHGLRSEGTSISNTPPLDDENNAIQARGQFEELSGEPSPRGIDPS